MKILCLFVRYGAEKYPDALAILDQWYQSHGLLDQRTLWIIDNARAVDQTSEQLGPRTFLYSGDNRAWEFSAWAHALHQVREENVSFDTVHFVTSAFNTLYTEYLKHFHPAMLDYSLKQHTCLGHIDSYPQPIQLDGRSSQTWIRTCFFFLSWKETFSITSWAAYQDRTDIFNEPNSREFRCGAPLSADYQARITAWLEGREMGGHTWHSPVTHGLQENVRFQQKTVAILNEHRLAITFREAGIRLVDFCWLYSLRVDPLPFAKDPMPELDQLKVRRKILGIPE